MRKQRNHPWRAKTTTDTTYDLTGIGGAGHLLPISVISFSPALFARSMKIKTAKNPERDSICGNFKKGIEEYSQRHRGARQHDDSLPRI
jgi:hypothetical protein